MKKSKNDYEFRQNLGLQFIRYIAIIDYVWRQRCTRLLIHLAVLIKHFKRSGNLCGA